MVYYFDTVSAYRTEGSVLGDKNIPLLPLNANEAKAAATLEEIIAQVQAEEALAAGANTQEQALAQEQAPTQEQASTQEQSSAAKNEPTSQEPTATEVKAPEATGASEENREQEELIPKEETEKAIIIPVNRRSSRKKKKQLASVLEMLREYEEEDARNIPKIEAQLMLNLDDAMEALIESPKK